jgi:1-acyl-sn-glycerol-3-phosphate acyltransferase
VPDYDTDFHPEPRARIVRRRLVTVPRAFLLFTLLTLFAPVVATAAVVVDLARWIGRRRPWMATRLLAFGWVFLAVQVWGLLWLFASWVRAGFGTDRRRLVEAAWPVQAWWARTLFRAVRRLFRLRLEVEGLEVARPGPVVAMFRHASIIDNLLPAVLLTDQLGLQLRWIIKRELLSYPDLDVAGKRLPNYFVDRNSDDPRGELRSIAALGENLDENEGVLIYPEGTRFTAGRRARALERLAATRPDLLERASALRHVLPPRLGGVLTLLGSGHDVLLCAHEGLGGFARLNDLWSGAIVGTVVRVRFWRFAAADIPSARVERVTWMYDRWRQIDDWIEASRGTAEGI